MSRIVVIGGTGYAGAAVVAEAANRGHQAVSVSRNLPEDRLDGVVYETADVTDVHQVAPLLTGADAVVVAVSPRGSMAGRVRDAIAAIAKEAAHSGVRLGVIGGAGSLQVSEDGPLVMDTPEFPEAFLDEARELGGVLEDLKGASQGDWFFVSPAGGFGAYNPGEAKGEYRLGDDVLLVDANGESNLSAQDLALAIVDEIEKPAHRNARFTVAY